MDALVDAASALATFVGVRYAQQPPDRLYRWGHGKAEAIAALMQALFLASAALALVFQSIERPDPGLFSLLPQVVDAVRVPVVAAGGVADGRTAAAAFMLGASAVQAGTALRGSRYA